MATTVTLVVELLPTAGGEVAAELRYVDARFGGRVERGLARWLWAGLASIVVLRLVALGGGAALLIWGAKGSVDAALPITKGPQKTAEVGPRGRI